MVTISDKGTEEELNKHLEQSGDTSVKKQEEDHQETKITQEELLRLYTPFPQILKGGVEKRIYSKFLDMFASLHVNIPFIKALQQMPSYIKYMKELLTRKSSLKGGQTIVMNKECSALIQPELPTKMKDPGSFHIPYAIGETIFDKGLCDLGASINLMPLSLIKKLQINELMPTDVVIRLADKTQKQAVGVVENVLVKVGNYFLPTNFVILEMEESHLHPIILGRPFLATARALIDMERGELILRIHDEQLTFNVFKPSQEADKENKEPREDHNKALVEETSIEAKVVHLRIPLVDEQDSQQLSQQKENQEEPKPPESYETSNKISLEKEVTKSRATVKETKKKAPRRWRNNKIPTEDFSPGDKVISAYFPVIPPHLPTIPSQLPKVFTINRILSLEHVEILDEANGDRFTAREKDLKHYQPP
ncbi:hypothetical protein Ahy_B09g097116 [Arachis hypogaea]|uniref:Aspartic peptidase DDI1-type domain-containing protein n=1 Tax=Arachis hypogaea TaxID=3818 RepID=A0A444XNE5_ARAHY|nr:hypothetical protein Ahy_B09g097116 [Arachis hypogaea]